jgi:hypothetical protein
MKINLSLKNISTIKISTITLIYNRKSIAENRAYFFAKNIIGK